MRALRNQVVEHEAARIHHEARVERAHRRLHARSLRHHGLRVVDGVQTLHSDLLHSHIGRLVHRRCPSFPSITLTIFHIVVHAVRRHQRRVHRVLRLCIVGSINTHLAVEAEGSLDQRRQADANHVANENHQQIDGLQSVDGTINDEDHQTHKRQQEEDGVAHEHRASDLQRLLRNHCTNTGDQQGSHQTRSAD